MSVENFDIRSFLQFSPPQYLCEKCCALLRRAPYSGRECPVECPICGVEYLPTDGEREGYYDAWQVGYYLKDAGFGIQFDNLIGHSRKLALIASNMEGFLEGSSPYPIYPPVRALFDALISAEKFVHFTTYGISHMLLGAIKMAAQQVHVRGIVSGVESNMADELTKYNDETRWLEVRIFERETRVESWGTSPHQKLIVIDGLLAFKGSANLTISGWRKAAEGRDVIEVVTDTQQVIELNNKFFSPDWAEKLIIEFDDRKQIAMETIPF